MIQDRQYREVLLTFCSGGSSNILSHSCVPESFCGKRDTPHMPSKLMLRRKWVETKLHNARKWVETKLHNGGSGWRLNYIMGESGWRLNYIMEEVGGD